MHKWYTKHGKLIYRVNTTTVEAISGSTKGRFRIYICAESNCAIGGPNGSIEMAKEVVAMHKHGKLGFPGGEIVATT